MLSNKLKPLFWIAFIAMVSAPLGRTGFARQAGVLFGVFPQRGSPGQELFLLLRGEGILEFGSLTGASLYGEEIPVLEYAPISNRSGLARLLIPEHLPAGETEITFSFENFAGDAFFIITNQDEQAVLPIIASVSPREGVQDAEITLTLSGQRLSELGDFGGLLLGPLDIPVVDTHLESDRVLHVTFFLPVEAPLGEMPLAVFFLNAGIEAPFLVQPGISPPQQPEAPAIKGLFPQQGRLESELVLTLEGEGFFSLGRLVAITIADVEAPVIQHQATSDNSLEISLFIPAETPPGEQSIAVFFDNARFESPFFVLEREPQPVAPTIMGVSPREGQLDREVELRLEGTGLSNLGALLGVRIADIEIPVMSSEVISDESLLLRLRLPADAPTGEGPLSILFENASFVSTFRLIRAPSSGAQPPTNVGQPPPAGIPPVVVVIIVVVVAGIGGVAGWRALRGRKASPEQPSAKIEFILSVDPGMQTLELEGRTLKMDIDLRFEVELDQGEQGVESSGASIVSRD